MAQYFSDEKAKHWLERQPTKPLSSKVVLQNFAGHVLILKPNYKPGWSLPGGMVEEGESPIQAAIRETREETGVSLSPDRLYFLGVRYGVSKRSGKDYVHFLFRAALTAAECRAVQIDGTESEDSRWVPPADLEHLAEHTGPLAARCLQGATATYSENDQFFVESVQNAD